MKTNPQLRRRDFLRQAGVSVAALTCSMAGEGAGSSFRLSLAGQAASGSQVLDGAERATENAKPRRPNFVFFLTDDQPYHGMSCTGNAVLKTPYMDQLAREGVLFEQAFVTTAICCCSRASIYTGQHMRRHGIEDFGKPLSAAQWQQTFPALLRQAGYRTAFLGKYAVGWTSRFTWHRGACPRRPPPSRPVAAEVTRRTDIVKRPIPRPATRPRGAAESLR
jgi:hypothetical protein